MKKSGNLPIVKHLEDGEARVLPGHSGSGAFGLDSFRRRDNLIPFSPEMASEERCGISAEL